MATKENSKKSVSSREHESRASQRDAIEQWVENVLLCSSIMGSKNEALGEGEGFWDEAVDGENGCEQMGSHSVDEISLPGGKERDDNKNQQPPKALERKFTQQQQQPEQQVAPTPSDLQAANKGKKVRPFRESQYRPRPVLSMEEQTKREGPTVHARLQPLAAMWRAGKLTNAEMAFCYVLVHVQVRHPRNWFGGKETSELASLPLTDTEGLQRAGHVLDQIAAASPLLSQLPLESLMFHPRTLAAITAVGPPTLFTLTRFRLRSVPTAAMVAMRAWLAGLWPLTLHTDIPSPRAVLAMQCRGTRVVSMLVELDELCACHLGHDPMDFLVHDLMHAHRMFGRGHTHLAGQIGALTLLSRALASGCLTQFCDSDSEFKETLDYAIADMNTDCLHTLQYVKHALIAAHLRADGLSPAAQMPPQLNETFYHFFQHTFISSWQIPLLPSAAQHTLLRMCEDGEGAEVDVERGVGATQLRALCVDIGLKVLRGE
eukprot:m.64072 g.64072  ORF g.64072 m.64072 type:complete len:489 (+) comp12503_c0_seq1:100-1566(+)